LKRKSEQNEEEEEDGSVKDVVVVRKEGNNTQDNFWGRECHPFLHNGQGSSIEKRKNLK
jgi:hypothetical protein